MTARTETFTLQVCAHTGDPGCLGWPEGYHDGPCEHVDAEFHRCTECGRDDVYGEIIHDETCEAARDAQPARVGVAEP